MTMDDGPARRRVASLSGLGGAIGALAVDALYVAIISQQGVVMPGGRVPFVAGWIASTGILAGIGSLTRDDRRRALLLGLAAAALTVLAMPAVFSVGVPLFICAMATGFGAVQAAAKLRLPTWLRLLVPILLIAVAGLALFIGFVLTAA